MTQSKAAALFDTATCASCGSAFGCGAQATRCWCARVELSETERDGMRQRFPADACLCPACIGGVARPFAIGGGPQVAGGDRFRRT